MMRLTLQAQSDREVILAIDGELIGREVDLLAAEIPRQLQASQQLVLNLQGTRNIDATGLALLSRWASSRLVLRGSSPFLRALLATENLELTAPK